ncbi:MAG: right-handed parallel beta-helix repeat-containing protein [Pontiellaceae bacterium]|jgi:hypothetical protein|nr:right-handed parallel beta-helix repeat-containing protein [Pontiellaceae bacterium]
MDETDRLSVEVSGGTVKCAACVLVKWSTMFNKAFMCRGRLNKTGRTAVWIFLIAGFWSAFGVEIMDGRTLQAALDAGTDIALKPGQVIELTETLKFRKAGQRIETIGAKTVLDYAKIVHADGAQGPLIDARGIAGAALSKLVLDGNRPGYVSDAGRLAAEPMLCFGGEGAVGQEVRNCIVIGSRSSGGWAAIHIDEGGGEIVVEDNIVFSSGADVRGNGRSPAEKPFGWGDGISTAGRNTTVVNNLIYDATDEGIMVQGAPGSLVKSNVVVALSREMLGGITLFEPFYYYELDAEKRVFDYRGVVVEENLILALGGRIHAGLLMGGAPWAAGFRGTTLLGAAIKNNHISGEACGYGYVANGIDDFEVTGNTSDAVHSGRGDGANGILPDAAAPFLFDPSAIGSSCLQDEFVPMTKSLVAVLRNGRTPVDALGYRDAGYPEEEARAVVRMAFVEMLGREPQTEESEHWKKWLQETRSNGDTLRCSLMATPEFVRLHGYINPFDLHSWRNARWLKMILQTCSQIQAAGADWPEARAWNEVLLKTFRSPVTAEDF